MKMYMRACLLSVMTFREQRARNPAIPPAGRPRRQRHLRSRRLYPHRPLRRSHHPFCRRTCRQKTLPSETAPPETSPQPSQPQVIIQPADQTTAAPAQTQPSPILKKGMVRPSRHPSPAQQPDRVSADGTSPGGAEPQGILQEAVDFSSEFIDKWKKPFYNAFNASRITRKAIIQN